MTKNYGRSLSNDRTASAEDCKEMCREKTLCDGWNCNRKSKICKLFSVAKKCSENHVNYNSGICEGL